MTDDHPAPDHPAPEGASTLIDVLAAARRAGYAAELSARPDGDLTCGRCHRAVNPAAVDVDDHWRLEGASDAADLLLVLAATCPACGARGTVVLGYGPNADAADSRVLEHLEL